MIHITEKQIIEYLNYCEHRKRLDKKTLKAYQIDLKQFLSYSKKEKENDLKTTIDIYITELLKMYKPKSAKRKIASLKAFYSHLEYKQAKNENPFREIDIKFKEEKLLPKTIPINTIQNIINYMYVSKIEAKTIYKTKTIVRDIAVIELLFATGMRISELCSLSTTDVDLFNKQVRILGKGSKERIIYIENKDVLGALNLYFQTYKEDLCFGNSFFINRLNKQLSPQSVRYMIKHYTKLAHINLHITPHMFRHSFATLLLEQDVDIRYIQKMLGHSSISTTEIYTYVSNTKQREILKTKHPRNLILSNINKL